MFVRRFGTVHWRGKIMSEALLHQRRRRALIHQHRTIPANSNPHANVRSSLWYHAVAMNAVRNFATLNLEEVRRIASTSPLKCNDFIGWFQSSGKVPEFLTAPNLIHHKNNTFFSLDSNR